MKSLSSKEKRESKKSEKKKRAEERHKMRVQGRVPQLPVSEEENAVTVVAKDISMMKIWANCARRSACHKTWHYYWSSDK